MRGSPIGKAAWAVGRTSWESPLELAGSCLFIPWAGGCLGSVGSLSTGLTITPSTGNTSKTKYSRD